MKFRKITEGPQFELADYVKQYLKEHEGREIKIYLGSDSQNKDRITSYATTVVFHVANTGCHVIFRRERVEVIKDVWTRLWKEAEKSVEVALYLRENGIEVDTIDLDYNIDPKKKSNRLVPAAVGYIESLGFKARVKPELLPAVHAADDLVN